MEKEFSDSETNAHFRSITTKQNGHEGFKLIEFLGKEADVNTLYTNKLNNLVGSFIESRSKDLTTEEKAELYEKLASDTMKLAVNCISLNFRMGQVLTLLVTDIDALLEQYQDLCKDWDSPVEFTVFLLDQFLQVSRLDK